MMLSGILRKITLQRIQRAVNLIKGKLEAARDVHKDMRTADSSALICTKMREKLLFFLLQ